MTVEYLLGWETGVVQEKCRQSLTITQTIRRANEKNIMGLISEANYWPVEIDYYNEYWIIIKAYPKQLKPQQSSIN